MLATIRQYWFHFLSAGNRVEEDDPDYLRVVVINLVGIVATPVWIGFLAHNLLTLEGPEGLLRAFVDVAGAMVCILMVLAIQLGYAPRSTARVVSIAILIVILALIYARPEASFSLPLASIYPPLVFLLLDDLLSSCIAVAVLTLILDLMILYGIPPWDVGVGERVNDLITVTVILWTLAIMMAGYVHSRQRVLARLRALRDELISESIHDPLTGLHNRRTFIDSVARHLARTKRESGGLGLIMFDIDHFKAYNDTYGHPAGDDVLKRVASGLKECFSRGEDLVFRLGGEEFCALFPVAHRHGAEYMADRALGTVAALKEPSPGGPHKHLSASAGLAWIENGYNLSPREVYDRVDDALYQAKLHGRARWMAAEIKPSSEPQSATLLRR